MKKVLFGMEVVKMFNSDDGELLGAGILLEIEGKRYRFLAGEVLDGPLPVAAKRIIKAIESEDSGVFEIEKEHQGLFTLFHTEEVEE